MATVFSEKKQDAASLRAWVDANILPLVVRFPSLLCCAFASTRLVQCFEGRTGPSPKEAIDSQSSFLSFHECACAIATTYLGRGSTPRGPLPATRPPGSPSSASLCRCGASLALHPSRIATGAAS